jgi:RNA-directed DNA polymerase
MVKQFFKSTGECGIPQGSPLSPLVANVALNDLDHALDRGRGLLTYVRYLDDMVVLAPDSVKGRAWADRALERIREEAEAIGVTLNTDKTRQVTATDRGAVFAFLGFEFRWNRHPKAGWWGVLVTPRPKKLTQVLHAVRDVLRTRRASPVREAVEQVNRVVRGWVNYFRVGHAREAFGTVKYDVERKVRRFVAKKQKRSGFGWKRWSREVVYGAWGLFADYQLAPRPAAARTRPIGPITP